MIPLVSMYLMFVLCIHLRGGKIVRKLYYFSWQIVYSLQSMNMTQASVFICVSENRILLWI